jgi:outer membrane usher protein FimD/PapC
VTSDDCRVLIRELGAETIEHLRQGSSKQFRLNDLLRQKANNCLAGYEYSTAAYEHLNDSTTGRPNVPIDQLTQNLRPRRGAVSTLYWRTQCRRLK